MNSTCKTMKQKTVLSSCLFVGACVALLCCTLAANAQYDNYDSDSNSDSDAGPAMNNGELGQLVRNSGRRSAGQPLSQQQLRNLHNQQQLAASRNSYNKQQSMQFAPTQHRRQYNQAELGAGYAPLSGAASHGRPHAAANSDEDEDERAAGANFGANFGPNFEGAADADGEAGPAEGGASAPVNLNQAASGYPAEFGELAGYGPAGGEGAEFGPSFGMGEGRRAKAASSLMGARGGYAAEGDDAGAPLYGPNSAINAGDNDDEGRSGYAPEASGDNSDNDDE